MEIIIAGVLLKDFILPLCRVHYILLIPKIALIETQWEVFLRN
jgi:hypothetical protein